MNIWILDAGMARFISTNALLLRDLWFVAHPEASVPPVAGTPGSTFFDVCRAFFPLDLVGCSNPLGHARCLGMRDNV